MAQYFFNRHNNETEPFAPLDSLEPTTTTLLEGKPASCPSTITYISSVQDAVNNVSAYSDANTYQSSDPTITDAVKNTLYANAQCELDAQHKIYLEKVKSDTTLNGVSNDASEKMSQLHMKSWHLLLGTGLMLGAVYNYTTSS